MKNKLKILGAFIVVGFLYWGAFEVYWWVFCKFVFCR